LWARSWRGAGLRVTRKGEISVAGGTEGAVCSIASIAVGDSAGWLGSTGEPTVDIVPKRTLRAFCLVVAKIAISIYGGAGFTGNSIGCVVFDRAGVASGTSRVVGST